MRSVPPRPSGKSYPPPLARASEWLTSGTVSVSVDRFSNGCDTSGAYCGFEGCSAADAVVQCKANDVGGLSYAGFHICIC